METAAAAANNATAAGDHQYRPSLRLCEVLRPAKGSCGFHLSRTQWDPYPWVSGVDGGSAAEAAGLLAGDCVLEVNGEDVLGERIGAVAARVRARTDKVSLLLWNAGSDPHVANSVCGSGPTPLSLQRLSSCLQAALQLLECPVCLEPASPRALQCANGHLLCSGCRARTERCPVCRVALGPRGRCLLADQLQALLASACQPAPRTSAGAVAATAAAAAAATSRRKDAPTTPSGVPLVQLKSRLILPPKSSSVEDICTRKQGSTQTEGGDVLSGGAAGGATAVEDQGPLRVRSLSTGQIPNSSSSSSNSPSPVAKDDAAEPLVHCPRGPECASTHPASRLMQHLREAHEGPLVQYFLSNAASSAAATLTVRAPAPGASETVALTTGGGGTLFVCSAERRVWLWALDAGAASEAETAGAGCRLLVKASDDDAAAPAPVFPLATPWEEVVASDRCLLRDTQSPPSPAPPPPPPPPSPPPQQQQHLEVAVVADKLASTALRAVSAVG